MDVETLLKIAAVVGPVLGYIGGILTEPIKTWFSTKSKLKELRHALHTELGRNYEHLILQQISRYGHEDMSLPPLKARLQFQCYEKALESPILLGQLKDYPAITDCYSVLRHVVETQDYSEEQDKMLIHFIDGIRRVVADKHLNKRLFSKGLYDETRIRTANKTHSLAISTHRISHVVANVINRIRHKAKPPA